MGVCPSLKRLEYLSKGQPASTKRGWQPEMCFTIAFINNTEMPPPYTRSMYLRGMSLPLKKCANLALFGCISY